MKTFTIEEITKAIELHKMWLEGDKKGARLDWSGANLRDANLRDANLQGAYLQGANLQGANLQGADLQDANLQGANLQGAYLQGAYLQGAYLQGAYLQGANLQGADLQGANLQGANLDFSCFPLWCGSKGIIACDRLTSQLIFHLTRLDTSACSSEMKEFISQISKNPLAAKFCDYREDVERMNG